MKPLVQTCSKCFCANPTEALYCYRDGTVLGSHGGKKPVNSGARPFHSPFVFPSGRSCQNFDQFVLACQERWDEAVQLLQQGYLENFFSGLGRADLAHAARAAAQFPDPHRGLDQLLDRLPSQVLKPPRLFVTPRELNLGQLRVGQDRSLELGLVNQGMRLLHGSIRCEDSLWLALGPAPGQQQKQFATPADLAIPLQVRGPHLRAGIRPLEGKLVIESNGGNATVLVRAEVAVTPFPAGVLAGATTPRQIAQKAKSAPKEAAILFENGAVDNWYRQNGWTYPVQGPTASGLGAVQQFFETLGLTAPPKVTISESSVAFVGEVGSRFEYILEVKAQESRPVYASAVSDQWWLQVGRPRLTGRTAAIPLVVPQVPHRPGEVLRARVLVTANGNQRFPVDVMLAVADGGEQIPTVLEVVEETDPGYEVIEEAAPAATVGRRQRLTGDGPRGRTTRAAES